MILKSHNPEAGLFSQINFVVTHLEAGSGKGLHIDWTEGLPYSEPCRGNLFEFLFSQLSPATGQDIVSTTWPHYRYTSRNAWKLYLMDDRWRSNLHRHWRRLSVRPEILKEAEEFRRSWPDRVIGLHVRNLNISKECPGQLGPTLEDYRAVLGVVEDPVFLATDNLEAVEFFRDLLGDRLITRDIARSEDMTVEYHLTRNQTFEDAKNCLIDALLLATCQKFIHSVSNIATAVLYMNPALPHVPLLGRPSLKESESRLSPDRLLPGREECARAACSIIHVEHPNWSDWILLYENGFYHRHDRPYEGGTWGRLKNGRIILQWVDWSAEEFELKEHSYRHDSAHNGVNSANTLCYRLAAGSQSL